MTNTATSTRASVVHRADRCVIWFHAPGVPYKAERPAFLVRQPGDPQAAKRRIVLTTPPLNTYQFDVPVRS